MKELRAADNIIGGMENNVDEICADFTDDSDFESNTAPNSPGSVLDD